jgi:hypothetical protein
MVISGGRNQRYRWQCIPSGVFESTVTNNVESAQQHNAVNGRVGGGDKK